MDDSGEFRAKVFEAEVIEGAFEDRVLNAGAERLADFGNLAKSLGIGNVVGNEVAGPGHILSWK